MIFLFSKFHAFVTPMRRLKLRKKKVISRNPCFEMELPNLPERPISTQKGAQKESPLQVWDEAVSPGPAEDPVGYGWHVDDHGDFESNTPDFRPFSFREQFVRDCFTYFKR